MSPNPRTSRVVIIAVAALLIVGAVAGRQQLRRGLMYLRYVNHARVTASREPGAVADWRKAFGDPDALRGSFQRREDNATAQRLVVLARSIGIDLYSSSQASSEWDPVMKYVSSEITKSGGEIGAAPDSVRALLEPRRATIDSIVDLLSTSDVPEWKYDYPIGVNPLTLRILNDTLTADALVEASRGHASAADRDLVAAWQLARSVSAQPRMIDELFGMALASTDIGAVRLIAVEAAPWRSRFAATDYPSGVDRAIKAETAWRVRQISGDSWLARSWRADYLDGMREYLLRLPAVSLTENPRTSSEYLDVENNVAPGRVVATIAAPGLDRFWLTAEKIMLDIELTNCVLDARHVRAMSGRWPAGIPDVASTRISGARWIYAVRPNGDISISLSRDLPPMGVPLTFEAHR